MIELERIYPYLILVGVTIGIVLIQLWRQARNANRAGLALIRLNESLNFDVPAFLRAAWLPLSKAGLRGISWNLDWFGVTVEGISGAAAGRQTRHEIAVAEMRLSLTIYRRSVRGERRYFDEALVETFLLLLRTDMWIKAGAADAAFSQMARLNLFLLHDMKNIAQFIQLLADQVGAVPTGREAQMLAHLQTAAPLMRQRADHVVRTLMARQSHEEQPGTVRLQEMVSRLCELHRLECHVDGAAEVWMPEKSLDSALDNLFKNYGDLKSGGANPLLTIRITSESDGVTLAICDQNLAPELQIERLFEPFWSGKPAGLGIGLYQAKQILEAAGGSLTARRDAEGRLQFVVRLPQKSSAIGKRGE